MFRAAIEKAWSEAVAVLGWVWGWIKALVAWMGAALCRFLPQISTFRRFLPFGRPTQPLGFVGLPMAAMGLAGPLLSGLRILGVVALVWGSLWAWGEKRYHSGYTEGYALAVKRVTAELARDTAVKEQAAEQAVAEVAPTPTAPAELKKLCASDPDCRDRGTP